ncbi:MAG: PKD domain-containing protein [Vicinamibacterales bacterium]
MHTITHTSRMMRFSVLLALAAVAGCNLQRQAAPGLSGPSEFGQSIVLSASPDQLQQDGVTQTVITALARNENSQPIAGLALTWVVRASDGTFVETKNQTSVTDSSGRASTTITAPSAPATLPTAPVVLTVTATPVGSDYGNASVRAVYVRLVPPSGTLPKNNDPEAAFTMSPSATSVGQTVVFNASQTLDETQPCGDACTYQWSFGDFGTDSGISVSHSYTLPGTYTVTLTVTDPRGGVSSSTKTIVVSGPTAPTAAFTSSPTSPIAGTAVSFTAAASTVGAGATITEYTWDFGDGTIETTTAVNTTHTFNFVGTYVVTLTIKDSLGRTVTISKNVTVA